MYYPNIREQSIVPLLRSYLIQPVTCNIFACVLSILPMKCWEKRYYEITGQSLDPILGALLIPHVTCLNCIFSLNTTYVTLSKKIQPWDTTLKPTSSLQFHYLDPYLFYLWLAKFLHKFLRYSQGYAEKRDTTLIYYPGIHEKSVVS